MGRLRSRLIVAFLLAALLPAVPLSLVVGNLLRRSFEPGRGATIQAALEAGMAESRERLRQARAALEAEAERLRMTPAAHDTTLPRAADGSLTLRLSATGRDEETADLSEPLRRWLPAATPGTPERVGDDLAIVVPTPDGGRLLVTRPLPREMGEHAARIAEGLGLLEALRRTRGAVLQGYIAPFLLVYVVLLGLVAAFGLVIARQIAGPLEALSRATHAVAAGRLDTRITPTGTGEVRGLEESMNRMLERLQLQQKEMVRLERQAAWRDLARRLAHEIKNPLTPIQLSVQELGERYDGNDPAFRKVLTASVEIVTEEVAALRRLVQEFSEFARLPQPAPVVQPVRPLLEEMERLYGPERVRLDDTTKELAAAYDGAELRRALIKLIDNAHHACRAARRPEVVTLAAGPGGDHVTIRVTDEGCGIPPESLERIFEPSFTTRSDGMGLGLAIVDGIVRGHGGRIRVDSRLGQGTTFHLDIPARREERTT